MSLLQTINSGWTAHPLWERSDAARGRMLSCRGEPLFLADWLRVLMIHFEVDADALQREVPFQLDLCGGRAFVSLVAFTMERMRPRIGGKLSAWFTKPIASHEFLNVRTYVRHDSEAGIHFLTEWLPNRLAVKLGPTAFALPYQHGRIDYKRSSESGVFFGRVVDVRTNTVLEFRATTGSGVPLSIAACAAGSLDEWLMERYTAFNAACGRRKLFRIWHPPWRQGRVEASVLPDTLLTTRWRWFSDARLVSANYSPGFLDVWMGRPHSVA